MPITKTGNFTMTYSHHEQDPDDEQMVYGMPNYHVICFSTEDNKGMSIPSIFFVPREIELPDELKNRHSFVRLSYNPETGQKIDEWLHKNCEHMIECDKFISTKDQPDMEMETSRLITSYHHRDLKLELSHEKLHSIYINSRILESCETEDTEEEGDK